MNISIQQKQIHRYREQTYGWEEGHGEEKVGSLGLADTIDTMYKIDN